MDTTDIYKLNSNVLSSSVKHIEIDVIDKVNQICELTGCSSDAAATVLYDCNYQVEVAVNKIFESTRTSDDWHEVAKSKKKVGSAEATPTETSFEKENDERVNTFNRSSRGRGRGKNVRNNNRNQDAKPNKEELNSEWQSSVKTNSRGRGRRPYRSGPNRNRVRHKNFQEDPIDSIHLENVNDKMTCEEKWPDCDEWLSDDPLKQCEVDQHKCEEIFTEELSNKMNCALNLDKVAEESTKICENDNKRHKLEEEGKKEQSAEMVAKSSTKGDVFGDYCRTKPPPPSTVCLSVPVKLITSSGTVYTTSRPDFNFSFGFNFNEYSVEPSGDKGNPQSFINNMISNDNSDEKSNCIIKPDASKTNESVGRKVPANIPGQSFDIFSSSPSHNNGPLDLSEKKAVTEHKSPFSLNKPLEISGDSITNNAPINPILPLNSSIIAPPGMSNHFLHQFSNSQYLSMLNISNGNQHFTNVPLSESSDNQVNPNDKSTDAAHSQKTAFIPDSKDYNSKSINSTPNVGSVSSNVPIQSHSHQKVNDTAQSEASGASQPSMIPQHLPHLPMNLNCYVQQGMLMNNMPNFMPPVHNNNMQSVAEISPQSSNTPNKQLFNIQTPRNFPTEDFGESSNRYEDLMQTKQQKHRSQNFTGNFPSKDDIRECGNEKLSKIGTGTSNSAQQQQQASQQAQSQQQAQMNRSSQNSAVQNVTGGHGNRVNHAQQPVSTHQTISNDPRRLAYYHPPSHPYNNNIYNCVTAASGPHGPVPGSHPYAMAPPQANMSQMHAQLHLMQHQMHNFPQSYQFPNLFQDHLMNTMVSNSSNRSPITQSNHVATGSGSQSSGQSRSRANNNLWQQTN